ncbi:MAG: CPBP family intramembrane metalloprotease [Lactobacillales bacterium]|nr:CPBP family intramembrane metalloprotease [Lactobacillales bacterium]
MKEKIVNFFIFVGLFILSQVPMTVLGIFIGLNSVYKRTFSIVETVAIILVVFVIIGLTMWIAKLLKIAKWRFDYLNKKTIGMIAMGYFACFFISMIGSTVMMIQGQTNTANQGALDQLTKTVPTIVMLLLTVVCAPILEEIAFRGGIIRLLFPNKQLIGGIVSAVCFGLIHSPTDIGSFIIYGGLGAVLATLFIKTKRIEVNISLHILWNAVAFGLMLLTT